MKKNLIAGLILIILISCLFVVAIYVWNGMYANILLFVYDEDGHCFYIYEWDS